MADLGDLPSVALGGFIATVSLLLAQWLSNRHQVRLHKLSRQYHMDALLFEAEYPRLRETELGLLRLGGFVLQLQVPAHRTMATLDEVKGAMNVLKLHALAIASYTRLREALIDTLEAAADLLPEDSALPPPEEVAPAVERMRQAHRKYREELDRLIQQGFRTEAATATLPYRAVTPADIRLMRLERP